ncbi:bifunctional diguanylate cyclase/phosphodiesterase [Zobellella denitrificans]|nr:EAL domain-containing protein [Zobellella denitrificans]
MTLPILARMVEFYRRNPLSLRLVAAILAVSTLFATLAVGVQLYTDYRRDITSLGLRLSDAERTFVPGLVDSLWLMDEQRIRLGLDSIVTLPYVSYATLRTAEGRLYTSGRATNRGHESSHLYVLRHQDDKQQQWVLGELTLLVDKEEIFASLWQKLWVVLASQAAKTMGVTLVILLLLHFSLSRHLAALADVAERLNLNRLTQLVRLDRRRGHHPDELDRLADAMNGMQQRLQREVAELERVHALNRRLSAAVAASPAAMIIMNEQGSAEYVNPALCRLLELPEARCLELDWPTLLENRLSQGMLSSRPAGWLLDKVRQESWQGELLWRTESGRPRWLLAHLSLCRATPDEAGHVLLVMEDITGLKEFEHQLSYQRRYDHLTNLPNRVMAMERLEQMLLQSVQEGGHLAVMVIAVPAYKEVTESLGIAYGDALLQECTQSLNAALGEACFRARTGDDEFLCALRFGQSAEPVEACLQQIKKALSRSVRLDNLPVTPGVAVGVAVYPNDGNQPERLYSRALSAQQRARSQKEPVQFFEPEMQAASYRSLHIATALKHAVEAGELRLFYQPIVDPRTGDYEGVEALVRWQNAELGWVSPLDFIDIAENTGEIVAIGQYILREACRQARQWQLQGRNIRVSVNVSPVQFGEPDFVASVANCLKETGLDADCLKLEITERLLFASSEAAQQKCRQLADMGIRLAMDDFGTGYSSLSYLRDLPFDIVKIDQSFVRHMTRNSRDKALVRGIIDLAHQLGMSVVAEGVEDHVQLELLTRFGCDLMQGYYFSKPVPPEQLFSKEESSSCSG